MLRKTAAAMFFILILSASAYAMPPHPDLIETYKNQNKTELLAQKMAVIKSRAARSAALKKSGTVSGTMHIPVLLVNFSTNYSAENTIPAVPRPDTRLKMPRGAIPAAAGSLILLILAASAKNRRWLRRAAPASVFILALTLSCDIGSSDGSSSAFPTSSSTYDALLNGSSSSDISVTQYYKDMSNSNLSMTFDIYGPVKASKSWTYYGANDSSGNDVHPGAFVHEAVALMKEKYPSVDFSIYDNDSDSLADTIVIIHQGPGEESGADENTIWSCQWNLSSAQYYGDGGGAVSVSDVSFDGFILVPEYVTTQGDSTVGVFCHELGHVLGLPDQYDTSYDTNGVGIWTLMSSGSWTAADGLTTADGSRPSPLLAWERYEIGGSSWVAETEVSASQDLSVYNIETSHTAYKIPILSASSSTDPDSMEQYLLLEGKASSSESASSTAGKWYVPATGILITQIHEGVIYSKTSSGDINAGLTVPHGINIVEAGSSTYAMKYGEGRLWLNGNYTGSKADLFAYASASQTISTTIASTSSNTCYYTSYMSVTSKTGTPAAVSEITITHQTSFPMTATVTAP